MKKLLILLMALTLLGGIYTLSFAVMAGSAHDFSGETWNSSNEICVVCHVPHSGASASSGLLWNHELSIATYTLYSSDSLDGVIGQPVGTAKLCLGCHDGTVAIENFSGTTGGTTFVTGNRNLGTDLSNDHPISVTYDIVNDHELYDPSSTSIGNSGLIDDVLENGMVQCASCHDVHNSDVETRGAPLLRVDNTGSALCLTCHTK